MQSSTKKLPDTEWQDIALYVGMGSSVLSATSFAFSIWAYNSTMVLPVILGITTTHLSILVGSTLMAGSAMCIVPKLYSLYITKSTTQAAESESPDTFGMLVCIYGTGFINGPVIGLSLSYHLAQWLGDGVLLHSLGIGLGISGILGAAFTALWVRQIWQPEESEVDKINVRYYWAWLGSCSVGALSSMLATTAVSLMNYYIALTTPVIQIANLSIALTPAVFAFPAIVAIYSTIIGEHAFNKASLPDQLGDKLRRSMPGIYPSSSFNISDSEDEDNPTPIIRRVRNPPSSPSPAISGSAPDQYTNKYKQRGRHKRSDSEEGRPYPTMMTGKDSLSSSHRPNTGRYPSDYDNEPLEEVVIPTITSKVNQDNHLEGKGFNSADRTTSEVLKTLARGKNIRSSDIKKSQKNISHTP